MTRVLAIADEVANALYTDHLDRLRPDLVIACGDLPFDYLEYIVTMSSKPLVYVPGNHDPNLRAPRPEEHVAVYVQPFSLGRYEGNQPGPMGCVNVDGRVTEAAGLRIAGLGGCMLYNHGPNQYSEAQMKRRALALELRTRAKTKPAPSGRKLDILVTHAPLRGVGDRDDLPHKGFSSFHRLVGALSPTLVVHGHIHPYGVEIPDKRVGNTDIVNAVGHRLLEIDA